MTGPWQERENLLLSTISFMFYCSLNPWSPGRNWGGTLILYLLIIQHLFSTIMSEGLIIERRQSSLQSSSLFKVPSLNLSAAICWLWSLLCIMNQHSSAESRPDTKDFFHKIGSRYSAGTGSDRRESHPTLSVSR